MPKKIRDIFNKRFWKHYLCITLGCFLLAFGDAVFITPFQLMPGGIISVGVIVQCFVDLSGSHAQVIDIVTWCLQIILLVVSFIFLGKRFTLRTLFASFVYPLFFTLLYRIPMIDGLPVGQALANMVIETSGESTATLPVLLISAIFGGAFIGAGVAFTYLGDGSSGGFDVLCVLSAKHTPIKEAMASFLIDATLVIVGIFCTKQLTPGLLGILAALVCAIAIQFVYSRSSTYVIAEIISDEYEKIIDYVVTKMERTTTVLDGIGAYSGKERKVIRVAFSNRELQAFRDFIAQTDPKAFVTFTNASMINGEGFDPLIARKKARKEKKNKGDASNGE